MIIPNYDNPVYLHMLLLWQLTSPDVLALLLRMIFLALSAVYRYGVEEHIDSLSNLTWLPMTALIGQLIIFLLEYSGD